MERRGDWGGVMFGLPRGGLADRAAALFREAASGGGRDNDSIAGAGRSRARRPSRVPVAGGWGRTEGDERVRDARPDRASGFRR